MQYDDCEILCNAFAQVRCKKVKCNSKNNRPYSFLGAIQERIDEVFELAH